LEHGASVVPRATARGAPLVERTFGRGNEFIQTKDADEQKEYEWNRDQQGISA
jgi:hypothetical protein